LVIFLMDNFFIKNGSNFFFSLLEHFYELF